MRIPSYDLQRKKEKEDPKISIQRINLPYLFKFLIFIKRFNVILTECFHITTLWCNVFSRHHTHFKWTFVHLFIYAPCQIASNFQHHHLCILSFMQFVCNHLNTHSSICLSAHQLIHIFLYLHINSSCT